MIIDRLQASLQPRFLPAEKLHGPTVAVTAIMTFAMIVIAAAGLAMFGAASSVSSGAESRFVVQVPAGSQTDASSAVAAVAAAPGVRSVKPISERDMRRTLERWLGQAASNPQLPVPSLLLVEIAPGAGPEGLAHVVESKLPQSTLLPETAELKPLLRSIGALEWLALSLVLLMGVATAAAIVLAARSALDTHRSTVTIMHGIGATDAQVTRLFQRKIAVDAIGGALAGSVAAAIVLLLVSITISATVGDLAAPAPLNAGAVAILAFIPVAAVAVAVIVAHWTVLRALRASL